MYCDFLLKVLRFFKCSSSCSTTKDDMDSITHTVVAVNEQKNNVIK